MSRYLESIDVPYRKKTVTMTLKPDDGREMFNRLPEKDDVRIDEAKNEFSKLK